jgi:hypothetical protein
LFSFAYQLFGFDIIFSWLIVGGKSENSDGALNLRRNVVRAPHAPFYASSQFANFLILSRASLSLGDQKSQVFACRHCASVHVHFTGPVNLSLTQAPHDPSHGHRRTPAALPLLFRQYAIRANVS